MIWVVCMSALPAVFLFVLLFAVVLGGDDDGGSL